MSQVNVQQERRSSTRRSGLRTAHDASEFHWFSPERARRRMRIFCWGLAPLTAAVIPVSTSGGEIAFAVLAGVWLLGGVRERGLSTLWESRVGVACVVLFGWLAVTLLWSPAPPMDALRVLVKYRTLLYVPILLSLFESDRIRRLSANGFVAAMVVTLAASWLMWFGLVEKTKWGDAENCAVFKNHITQSVMMAFAAFLLARSAAEHVRWRWTKATLAVLAVVNVLCLVSGRTGYVIVAVLAVYLAWAHLGRRGLLKGAAACAGLAAVVFVVSPSFHDRVTLGIEQARGYFDHQKVDAVNSIGLRLQFYATSLEIAAGRPVFGHGVGAFRGEYRALAEQRGIVPTDNPHNEYLMILVQSGVVGLALLIALFVLQWRASAGLPRKRRMIARGLVLTIAVGCAFNSLLLDRTEGNFFAFFTALCFAGPLTGRDEEEAANADRANDAAIG
jgi:O-antigen ligase